MKLLPVILGLAVIVGGCTPNTPPPSPSRFVAWKPLETDKAASLWLIKRCVAPDADIQFVDKGTFVTNGIAVDTPDATLRRTHTHSCTQSVLEHYSINATSLVTIGAITHDIEINAWGPKRYTESTALDTQLMQIVEANPDDPHTALAACFSVLDALRISLENAP